MVDNTKPEFIDASSNSVGPGIGQYVPGYLDAASVLGGEHASTYVNPNNGVSKQMLRIKKRLAKYEGVDPASLLVSGSGLETIEKMPAAFGAKSVVSAGGDFMGYGRAARLANLPAFEVHTPPMSNQVDTELFVRMVTGLQRPLVLLTFPGTNPGQAAMPLDLPLRLLEANPNAIVVMDAAYRGCDPRGVMRDLPKLALAHDRLIYMNVSAKDFGTPGARLSWIIAQDQMLALLRERISPFPAATFTLEYLARLLDTPMLVQEMHQIQAQATQIYSDRLSKMNRLYRCGPSPWALIYIGDKAEAVVAEMLETHNIAIQLQVAHPDLKGWVRISATVPHQARRVMDAFEETLLKLA